MVTNSTWQSIATGQGHACAVRFDNRLLCWGDNRSGQLGDGTNIWSYTPKLVHHDKQWLSLWVHVATGSFHSCAVFSNYTLFCWVSAWSSCKVSGCWPDA